LEHRKEAFYIVAIFLAIVVAPVTFSAPNSNEPPLDLELPYITMFENDMTYAFMMSWDDGNQYTDTPVSLIEDKYGVKHTSFLITSRITEENIAQWMSMLFRGHDIEVHGRNHTAIGLDIPEDDIREIVEGGAADLNAWLGYDPIAFAYPFGSVSDTAANIVLETFDFSRGTKSEGYNTLGTWPLANVRDVFHSIGDLTGLQSTYSIPSVSKIYERFLEMIDRDGRGYQTYGAFKTYGHTDLYYIDLEGRDLLDIELEKISMRNDTWLTSWGEAWAYNQIRMNTSIQDYSAGPSQVQFTVTPEYDVDRYPLQVTVKCEVPANWETPLVEIGGQTISNPLTIYTHGEKFILFNIRPRGQTVNIIDATSDDTVAPFTSQPRLKWASDDLIMMFDITDSGGFVQDVNVSIQSISSCGYFELVENPLFWGNSTYGVVLLDAVDENTVIRIDAIDSNGNRCSTYFTIIE